MNETCGCCEGLKPVTPVATANRPGLDALAYRVGTHATFLETMKSRLSAADYSALGGLTTRAADDPGVALLDAWATVAEVLTFYQERIANEGYLRTATERRSRTPGSGPARSRTSCRSGWRSEARRAPSSEPAPWVCL